MQLWVLARCLVTNRQSAHKSCNHQLRLNADHAVVGPGHPEISYVSRAARQSPLVKIIIECFKRGLVIQGAGESAVRFSPPLIVNREQVDFAVDTFDAALQAKTDLT